MITIIMILIIFFTIYLFYQYNTYNNTEILNKKQLINILINNYDKYYTKFTKLDLQVRDVKSIEEYINKIMYSPVDIDDYSKSKIYQVTEKIDKLFDKYKTVGFDGSKASKIKWKIGIIKDKNYEFGYPHTRNDTIIIPSSLIFSNKLLKTLLHEKVHVYQKMYPEDIQQYLTHNQFRKTDLINPNKRANPDIDDFIYINSNNEPLLCLYNQDLIHSVNVKYSPIDNPSNEHPFEHMAYFIQNDIKL